MTCLHKLVADVAVLAGDRVVMVRYRDPSKYDGETGWFLPDDYLQRLEHPERAAQRILSEQVGLEAADLTLGQVESFEGNGFWHLIFHYVARLPAAELRAGPNVAAAEWFSLASLPPAAEVAHEGWALDTLAEILR